MNYSLFIFLLFFLQGICFLVGKRVSKNLNSNEDYFLAGRDLKFIPLLMTLIATQIGGGLVLGSAEEAYRYGWYVLLYPVGACLGLLVLASGVGRRMAAFKVSTIAQLFEVVYASKLLKQIASLFSILSLFMILIGQVIASHKFMVSIGFVHPLLFFAFWSMVIGYTAIGGFKAVVATDMIQALFFIGSFLLCFIYTFTTGSLDFGSTTFSEFEFNADKWTGWLLMPLLFMLIEQDMAQRCFAARSGKIISWASGCAAICIMIVCAIPVYFGILARVLRVEIPQNASIFMTIVQNLANPSIVAFVACAILAAIISTADSLINAISSNVAQDFEFKWVKRKGLRASQIITGIIGFTAFGVSFFFNNIVDILIQSYELSVSCLLIPVVSALFIKEGKSLAAGLAIIGGAIGFCVFRIIPAQIIPREVVSLLLSGIGFILGYLLSFVVVEERNITREID